ncbi:MAG: hypothetical protein H0V63_07085 [Burkholderiaceae bacterium]|nr:hypothetical protein [Burkholderiaceae bacterium]
MFDQMFGSPNDQAMWAMGAGLLGVRRGDEGKALMGGMNAYNQASKADQQKQLWQSQMDENRAQAEARKAAVAAAQQKLLAQQKLQAYLAGIGQEQYAPGASVMKPGSMENAPRTKYDPRQAMALGMSIEDAQKLAGMEDWGRTKVARTVDVDLPDGSKGVQQQDEFGRPVGAPMKGYVAPVSVNQGDRQTFAKPIAGNSLPINMSASDRDASARGWAANRVAQGHLALAQRDRGGPAGAKAPNGFEWVKNEDGSWGQRPIAGGPKDTSAKDQILKDQVNAKADIVLANLKKAEDMTGFFTTGLTGSGLGQVPGTTAYNKRSIIDVVKANIGFDALAEMRRSSPTGGALGNVTVRELELLQSTLGALNPNMSDKEFRTALAEVKTHYMTVINTMNGGAQGGGGSDWGNSAPGAGSAWSVVR